MVQLVQLGQGQGAAGTETLYDGTNLYRTEMGYSWDMTMLNVRLYMVVGRGRGGGSRGGSTARDGVFHRSRKRFFQRSR